LAQHGARENFGFRWSLAAHEKCIFLLESIFGLGDATQQQAQPRDDICIVDHYTKLLNFFRLR